MFLAKRSNGIYFIEYLDTEENKTKRVSTGHKDKRMAQRFMRDFVPAPSAPRISSGISLNEFRKEYIQFIGYTHTEKYLVTIEYAFRRFSEYVGNKPIDLITTKLCQQFVSSVFSRKKFSAAQFNRTLKAAFNVAIEWDYIRENPFKKVRLPRMEKSVPLFISEAELNEIISHVQNEQYKAFYYIAFYTGMRLNEITNLKWNAIDLAARVLYVKNTTEFTTKSKKERMIPINDKLYKILEGMYDENIIYDYVFRRHRGIRLSGDYVSQIFKAAVLKTKVNPKVHFHTLRHSFASNLVQRGANIYAVKELLGHEDITTTQIYAHLQAADLHNAVKLLNL